MNEYEMAEFLREAEDYELAIFARSFAEMLKQMEAWRVRVALAKAQERAEWIRLHESIQRPTE